MKVPDSVNSERPVDIATSALARMVELDIPPTPENYTVWYAYQSGSDPDVAHMIDHILKTDGNFTKQRCNALYLRYMAFSENTAEDERETKFLAASSDFEKSVESVMDLLNEAGAGAARYGEALADVDGELRNADGADRVRQIVSNLVAETKQMAEQNELVNQRLEKSNQEIADLQQRITAARREAMCDPLTGLDNRRAFDEQLRKGVEESVANNTPISLLMLDIDHFKKFNDTHGHQLGDEVLRLVARCLVDCTKGRDTAARYGGEDFAIVLPETDLEGAMAVAEQVRETVNSKRIVRKSTGESLGGVTLSGGAALFSGNETLEEFIERADSGLYEAKENGRNRIVPVDMTQDLRVVGGSDLA